MHSSKKKIALWLCLFLIAATFFCALSAAQSSSHLCSKPNCETCQLISHVLGSWKLVRLAAIFAALFMALFYGVMPLPFFTHKNANPHTLISLKVQLNP